MSEGSRRTGEGLSRSRLKLFGTVSDFGKSGVDTDALRQSPGELDSVVTGGVVTRGEHNCWHIPGSGGEIDHVS